nr:hypothetical protein [Proteus mirabilis]
MRVYGIPIFQTQKISIDVLDNIDLTASRLSPKSPELSRMAGIIFLIWSLTKRISCNSTWLSSVNDHLEKHQGVIPFNSMGFDNNNISGLKIYWIRKKNNQPNHKPTQIK